MLPPAGQGHDQGRLEFGLFEGLSCHLVAVHPGLADVEDNDLGTRCSSQDQRIGAVVGELDVLNVNVVEEPGQATGGVQVVIDDEDSTTLKFLGSVLEVIRRGRRSGS